MPRAICPCCGRAGRISAAQLGRKLKCPACRLDFIAAEQEEAANAPPVDGPGAEPAIGAANPTASPGLRKERRHHPWAVPAALAGAVALGVLVGVTATLGVQAAARPHDGAAAQSAPAAAVAVTPASPTATPPKAAPSKAKLQTAHGPSPEESEARRHKQNRKLSQDAFRKLVQLQQPEMVVEYLGPPDETSDGESGKRWVYHDVATDPATGTPTRRVELVFDSLGRVAAVNFN